MPSRATATCGCASSPAWRRPSSATSPAGSRRPRCIPASRKRRNAAGTPTPRRSSSPTGPHGTTSACWTVHPVPADRGPYAVDPAVPALGKWLTFLADSADQPGSAMLADLTGFLAEHWATGQSPLEDASLAAQLAWIDPPPGMTGLQAALATEDPAPLPARRAGHRPGFRPGDPGAARPQLRPGSARPGTSPAMKRAAAEISSRPQGAARTDLGRRVERDLAAAGPARDHRRGAALGRRPGLLHQVRRYLADGGLPQPRRDYAATAAARLDRLERAQAAYDAERAREDPFVLAGLRTTGEAFAGEVVSAEPSRTTISVAGRGFCGRASPSVPATRCAWSPAGYLICPAHPATRPDRRPDSHRESADVVLEVVPGHGHDRKPTAGAVPAAGEHGQLHHDPGTGPKGSSRPPTRPPGPMAGPPSRPAAGPSRSRDHERDHRSIDPPPRRTEPRPSWPTWPRPDQRGVIVDSPPGAGKSHARRPRRRRTGRAAARAASSSPRPTTRSTT